MRLPNACWWSSTPVGILLTSSAFILGVSSPARAEVIISAAATSNISCTSGVCTPTHVNAVLNVSTLQSMLSSGNVTVNTAGSKATDIVVSKPFIWTSAHTLTLDAYHSVTVNKSVVVSGSGGLTILTNDGGTGGLFSFGKQGYVNFWNLADVLTINGSVYTLVDNIATLASDIAANGSGKYALAESYNASVDGTYSSSPISTNFSGALEGLGNKISNLSINDPTHLSVGFIGGSSAAIENLALTKVDIESGSTSSVAAVGGLVGNNSGLLTNDSVSGKVLEVSGEYAGGLVGVAGGAIVHCSANVFVFAQAKSAAAGGLVGYDGTGTITNSFATGAVKVRDYASAGGLVGMIHNESSLSTVEVTSSYATGAVSGQHFSTLGGLVGSTDFANISQSYATGSVTGNSRSGGGIYRE
jgi:hypothetical protein